VASTLDGSLKLGKRHLCGNDRCRLGESPLWDPKRKALYWVDSARGIVYRMAYSSRKTRKYRLPQTVGAVVLHTDSSVLVTLKDRIAVLDLRCGALKTLCRLENDRFENRLNDAKCDRRGRLWFGSYYMPFPKQPAAALYVLDLDLKVTRVLSGVTISNGLCWSADDATMYYVDSFTREVVAFDYELASGILSHRRCVIRFADSYGLPDGMTIDREDRLWIALFNGGRVVQVDPGTGAILREIHLPASEVTSCAFGGPRLDELFISTAGYRLSPLARRSQTLAGRLFQVKVEATGREETRFGGGAPSG
jgi:sugar lactone lactonase YvrE